MKIEEYFTVWGPIMKSEAHARSFVDNNPKLSEDDKVMFLELYRAGTMTKKELDEYAEVKLDIELDRRQTKKKMVEELTHKLTGYEG